MPLNIGFPEDLTAILKKAVGGRSVGEYLAALARENWDQWQWALSELGRCGWNGDEVLAACNTLSGLWLQGQPRGEALAAELHDDGKNDGVVASYRLDRERWGQRLDELRSDDALAFALWAVVRELKRNNGDLAKRIERMRAGKGRIG